MTKRSQHFWIDAVLLAFTVVSAAAAITVSKLSPLTKDDLRLEIADLRSFAQEGAQLTNQHLAGQTTQTFFDSQAEQIKDKVDSSLKSLRNSEVKPEIETDRRRAVNLAEQLSSEFHRLSTSQLELETSGPRLKTLGKQLREMEERMK